MKYTSTRGLVTEATFEEVLFSGYAADGGLFLPAHIPKLTKEDILRWSHLSYPDLVKELLGIYIAEEEIPRADICYLVDAAFSHFTNPQIIKLTKLKSELNVLELFHGPTLAFKDLAMTCVGQMLNYFLEKRRKHITLLVGTSGDTGSSAIHSVRGLHRVNIIVLLPRSLCSRIQELQMTTVTDDNVHVFRVAGTSDDLDNPIKKCFLDGDLVKRHNLCSVNSINWGRILVQMAHYFYAFFQLSPECDKEVEIVVPTGACGNITAGIIAREMGLPIKLISAVNSNDTVARTLTSGDYSPMVEFVNTIAPAMNIQIPYNVERIVYLMNGRDSGSVRQLMDEFENKNKATIPQNVISKIQIKCCVVTDEDIKQTMRRCWKENGYLLCPHTAVGVKYHYNDIDRNGSQNIRRVCFATASAAKFEEAVRAAGLQPAVNQKITALDLMPTKYTDMEKDEDWEQIIRNRLESIYQKRHSLILDE